MFALPRGLYERLITKLLSEKLRSADLGGDPEYVDLRSAEAADRFAWHIGSVVERVIDDLSEKDRVTLGAQLTQRLIDLICGDNPDRAVEGERLAEPDQQRLLRAIRRRLPDGSPESIKTPLIPLLDTTLLTNAPGEPRVGHQIEAEIASADRIDIVMAFVRRSGIAPLCEPVRRHVQAGRIVRVLTTTYTGFLDKTDGAFSPTTR